LLLRRAVVFFDGHRRAVTREALSTDFWFKLVILDGSFLSWGVGREKTWPALHRAWSLLLFPKCGTISKAAPSR